MASRKPTTTPVRREPRVTLPAPSGDPFQEYREIDWQRRDSSPTVAAMDVEAELLDPEDDP